MPMETGDDSSPGPKVQKVREPRHSSAKPATVPCWAVAYGVQLHGKESRQTVNALQVCNSAATHGDARCPIGTCTRGCMTLGRHACQ